MPVSLDYLPVAGDIEDIATNAPEAIMRVQKQIDNCYHVVRHRADFRGAGGRSAQAEGGWLHAVAGYAKAVHGFAPSRAVPRRKTGRSRRNSELRRACSSNTRTEPYQACTRHARCGCDVGVCMASRVRPRAKTPQ